MLNRIKKSQNAGLIFCSKSNENLKSLSNKQLNPMPWHDLKDDWSLSGFDPTLVEMHQTGTFEGDSAY